MGSQRASALEVRSSNILVKYEAMRWRCAICSQASLERKTVKNPEPRILIMEDPPYDHQLRSERSDLILRILFDGSMQEPYQHPPSGKETKLGARIE